MYMILNYISQGESENIKKNVDGVLQEVKNFEVL